MLEYIFMGIRLWFHACAAAEPSESAVSVYMEMCVRTADFVGKQYTVKINMHIDYCTLWPELCR